MVDVMVRQRCQTEEGLRLMDRYPWARLHPIAVHPEFVERVRVVERELIESPDIEFRFHSGVPPL